MFTVLCADKKCKQKNSCVRYVTDPAAQLGESHRIRVEASLHDIGFEECKKFVWIKEATYEIDI